MPLAKFRLPAQNHTYFALDLIEPRIPLFISIAAASFLYIGMVDLAPILHHDSGFKSSVVQLAGLLSGVGTILLLHNALVKDLL